MKLLIDNLDNSGPQDYTMFVEEGTRVSRRLNQPAEMNAMLVSQGPDFIVPASGARVELVKSDGDKIFTGYMLNPPEYEYLGWTMDGPMYRYRLAVISDECLLDRKPVPVRAPIVGRTAGAALKILTEDVLPGMFDLSGIGDVEVLPSFEIDARKTWSQHAAEIARRARAVYRVHDGTVIFSAIPPAAHTIGE